MGKFFNHYMPDRAVGFAHRAASWHYTLGHRSYDLGHGAPRLVMAGRDPSATPGIADPSALPGSKPQSRGSGARSKTPS